jgi:catechol 2,3-dioxygenase-like lactoylglutathione lyase family enzyme
VPGVPIVALDHVQLAAPPGSEDAARLFFGELLGLAEIDKPASLAASGGVWFTVGSQQLHIGIQDPFVPTTKGHPALLVDPPGLDSLAARLAGAGAPVNWDERLAGFRRFYTADPWGNRIELLAPTRSLLATE